MAITINRTTSLDGAILPEFMPGLLYMNENQAHQFVITCTRGGSAVTLTGGITGRFMRADGQTILLSGSISSGKANLTLPQSCYIVPGRFTMAIFNVTGNAVTTIYALTGNVARTQTDTLVDPGNTVPTIDNLLAEIDAMRQATADAEAAATKAVRYDTTQSLTDANKTTARGNIDAAGMAQVVRHDAAQNLTDANKTTARGNIDAAGLAQVVRHDASQNLNETQKTTARGNIDAAGLTQVVRHDAAQNLTETQKSTARNNIGANAQQDFSDLKSALSEIQPQITGLILGDGASEAEQSVYKNFRYLITGPDIDLTGFRISIVINSEQWPKYISLSNGSTTYSGYFGNSDEITLGNHQTRKIIIGYDWSHHTTDVNGLYADSHIIVGAVNRIRDIENSNVEIHNALNNYFSGMIGSAIGPEDENIMTPTSTYAGKYIMGNGVISNWTLGTIETYAVEAGKIYHIAGYYATGSVENAIVAFSEENTIQMVLEKVLLMPTKTSVTWYSLSYIPEKNGYIFIVQNDINESSLVVKTARIIPLVGDSSVHIESLGEDIMRSFEIAPYEVYEYTTRAKAYIDENLHVSNIENEVFSVDIYPVSKGENVLLFGTTRLATTSYPIAVFGVTDTQGVDVIIDGTSGDTYTDYSVQYQVLEDGYIIIAAQAPYTKVYVYSASLKYKGDSPATAIPIKLQVFGDSITDNENNTWSGHTTWLNHIQKCFDGSWNLTVINSSYGGGYMSRNNEYSVVNRVQTMLDLTADVYFVWAGTNDYAGRRQLGDMTSDDSTYIGALKAVIEYITTNTSKMLIVATPMQRWNSFDQSQYDYGAIDEDGNPTNGMYSIKQLCEAAQKVCDLYGIPCIRMDKEAGFNKLNISKYAGDGLHPHTNGSNERIATMFADEIKRHFPRFQQ